MKTSKTPGLDHDHLFKDLIRLFFREFLELFVPQVAARTDWTTLEFKPNEMWTDALKGERHEADVLATARWKGEETCFLVHVENQSKREKDFAKRMFRYFALLSLKFDLPIYPVAIFSYGAPKNLETNRYEVIFPGRKVLDFEFEAIQLNRLDWQQFLDTPNLAASALMAKMNIAPQDRAEVKSKCLEMLAGLNPNEAQKYQISGFIDAYLRLNEAEQAEFERRIALLAPPIREKVMEIATSWKEEGISIGLQKGRQEGRQEGQTDLAVRLLEHRFGALPRGLKSRIKKLDEKQLGELALAIFGFSSHEDLELWLKK